MATLKVTTATLALTALAGTALAQQTQVQALEARVAQLESKGSVSSGRSGVDLTVYGYIKGDLIYDLDTDLGTTVFGLGSITPGGNTGSNFRGQAIQSRLGIRASGNGASGVLEGDFFGSGGGGFRLRQAYVDIGNLRFGQNWTNFMPIESYPSTLDFQGPAGIPFARVTQARYTYDTDSGFGYSASIEQSAASSSDPALTAAAFYTGNNYFLKLAAVGTTLSDPAGNVDAFGVNLSGNAQLWEGGSINASLTSGEAISSYQVFGGSDTFGGSAVESLGLTLAVSQQVSDWNFGLAYGLRDNNIGAASDTETLETIHLTANYQITETSTIGLEYIAGTRDLFDGTSASADRVIASVQYNF